MILLALACAARAPVAEVREPEPPAELLYLLMVDRFENGDPTNDQASPGPAVDLADPQAWHGGDLAGVRGRLDHLQALGVSKLWLTPVFRTRTEPMGGWGAYHGYWQWDPFQVEPRFGTEAELLALAMEAQARGIGLLLDLVSNHVGYEAPLLATHPDWFHAEPSIADWSDRRELEEGQVHGLPDLDQGNPAVRAWLHEAAMVWQSRLPLAGYRVDAVRHVPNEFLGELGAAVRARGGRYWLGEDFTGDPVELAASQESGGFTHVFDFPLHYAMTEVFCDDAPPAALGAVLSLDRLYPRPDGLVTFLDNHDLPRIHSRCRGDEDRVLRALAFQLSARGLPAISWGLEAGLAGAHEPENRPDMRFSPLPLAEAIRRLVELRRGSAALDGGSQRVLSLSDQLLVLLRQRGDRALVLAVNQGEGAAELTLPTGRVRAVLTAERGALRVEGGAEARVPPRAVRAWHLEGVDPGRPARTLTVRVELRGAPEGELRLVGSDPALGAWSAHAGLPLSCQDGVCKGSLRLPEGAVVLAKPVRVEGNEVRWAEGPNRALLVGQDLVWSLAW